MNHVMDTRFELQYKAVAELLFQSTLLCTNGSWVCAGSLTQPSYGQDNQVIIILQLPMSVATVEEENVGVSGRLNQPTRQRFPNHRHA